MNLRFKVGDRVIHPWYGLGQVTRLALKQFVDGEKRLFYEIFFPGSTLWIPLNLSTSGIRKLSAKTEIASCRLVLKSPAKLLGDNFHLRQVALNEHIKEGTLSARCEVVRDLTAYGWQKPLSGTITTLLQAIKEVLYQEWAAIEGITLVEAATEIQILLEKGKPSNGNR